MTRLAVLTLALAGLALAVPAASACCHLHGMEDTVGPCGYMWRGDLVFTGQNRLDEAHVGCTVASLTLGADWTPCDGRLPEGLIACGLP